ncbi:MAG: Na+/H+ antiporter subunit B [Alphaproteobacteria bacterium]|nr:Na+/H+ antiporter subunit B [Alphaproteobacteria bacterium]
MNSLILNAATRVLVALMLLFSVYMLLRGHNEPGGGFIGGLIAAIGFALYAIAHGTRAARRALRTDPGRIAMAGLGIALFAGLGAALAGEPLFTGQWAFIDIGDGSKGLPVSTVLLFDIGVYLVVVGAVLTLVLALEDEV